MPWVVALSTAANYAVNKNNNKGGGSGGGPPAYQPIDQPGRDQNFINAQNQYQSSLYNQQGTTAPQNDRLYQEQMNNPQYGWTAQDSNYANNEYIANASAAGALAGQGYTYANQQINNAQDSHEMMRAYFPTVQRSVTALQNQAGDSKAQYDNLMQYQQGQLGNIQNSQNNLYGAGNQVLQAGFDPQNALYNRTQQQLTDQNRAAQAARGIQSSPYGAALENSANENFNIDWQNQQLGRQAQGLQAAQGAYGSAQGMGNSYTGTQAGLQAGSNEQYASLQNAAQNEYLNYVQANNQTNLANTQNIGASQQNAFNLANQAAQSAYQAGQVGFNTNQQIYGAQNQAIQNYQGNNQNFQQGLNQLQSNDLSYMNYGQGAQNQAFNQNAYNQQQNQQAIGSIVGPLSNKLQNTNWGNIFGGSSPYTTDQWNTDQLGYMSSGYDGP